MSIDLIATLLETWDCQPFVENSEGNKELITKVALSSISAGTSGTSSEAELNSRLASLSTTRPELAAKCASISQLLSSAHEMSKIDIENLLGLTAWDPGPDKNQASKIIISCYLKKEKSLKLKNLDLTSLPAGIKHLQISSLNLSNTNYVTLPELPASLCSLTCFDCRHLSSLPDPLPSSLEELFCNDCTQLTMLPDPLPSSLKILSCTNCNLITKLPTPLPDSLETLICEKCTQLTTLPNPLPNTLINLFCSYCNLLTELPTPLPDSLQELFCNHCTQLTVLPNPLPENLTQLYCSECTSLTALPDPLPLSLMDFNCSRCTALTAIPYPLPPDLTFLTCYECTGLLTRPIVSDECDLQDFGNTYGAGTGGSAKRFEISGANRDAAPLWCSALMNGVRQKHRGEEYSLVSDEYKMWCDESTSTIRIARLEGEISLTFTFDKTTGILKSVKDQNDADVPESDLKKPDNLWCKILNGCAAIILEERGIRVEESTIKVHPKAISVFPSKVLDRLSSSVTNVRYLENDYSTNAAIDVGGVSRQFVSDLTKVLFVGNEDNPHLIHLTDEGMLAFNESEPGIYQKFGKLLSFVLTNEYPLITGVYLNPKFYPLLKSAQGGLSTNQLAVQIIKETLNPSEMVLKALDWYENPTAATKSDALICLRDTFGSELADDEGDIEIRKEIESDLLEPGINEAKALLKVLEGMTPAAKAKLGEIPEGDLSTRIQGTLVTQESLKAAIKMEEGLSEIALERRDWILERIDEKGSDPEWLSRFVSFITGQPFLPPHAPDEPPIKLKFLPGEHFNAHTCFNMLDVPAQSTASEAEKATYKEQFLSYLDICINDPKNFTKG